MDKREKGVSLHIQKKYLQNNIFIEALFMSMPQKSAKISPKLLGRDLNSSHPYCFHVYCQKPLFYRQPFFQIQAKGH